ncbi:monooxygenase [Aureobasidium pullulans]|uniref:Monooxygenase n=1 Tax=Aureobasidium pullulans TaxID=5580 RepID=A0A4S9SUY8_AURPU|nr:monooxygenase [Aureobasidium pullulans]THZ14946.1 monooxygenase [Aureobasidium pullulans]
MTSRTTDEFHVAIVGAGIGGLALAISLHKKGVSFTLYEGAKEYSVVGAGIGFAPNGMRTMDLIEPAFRPLYEKICVGNKGEQNRNIFFEGMLLEEGLGQDQPWFGDSAWGHPQFNRKSAHRKELLEIMTSFIPIENVKFNKYLESIEQHSDKVFLKFADGEVAEASVLAGADGIKSIVREHVLRPSHPEGVAPVYADAYCYRAVIPMSEAYPILGDLTDVAKFYFGHNRSAITYRISGGEELNFLFCVADPKPWALGEAVTEKTTHGTMMADFEGPGVDARFIKLLAKAQPIKWGFFHHWRTSTYHRGRVVLLGDAAHASLPFQAAGAAQGLEDALVLSNVLSKIADTHVDSVNPMTSIEIALEAYGLVRRPRAQKQLEQSAEVGEMIFFQHEEAGSDMSKILPRLQEERFDWLWFHDIEDDVNKALARMHEQGMQ